MTPSDTVEMAADVVAAFVSNNPVPRGELPALIQTVHAALARLGGEVKNAAPKEASKGPAVSIRRSITPEYLICLEDGKHFKSLKRHLVGAWPDAGSISREMEASVRLSYGRARLHGGSVGDGESDRIGRKGRDEKAIGHLNARRA